MRRVLRLAIAALALAGCGGGEENAAQAPTSGARLKVRWFEFDDGTRLPLPPTLHDADRREPCTPARWDDGALRCTPAHIVLERMRFADAACTDAASAGQEGAVHGAYTVDVGGEAQLAGLFRVEPAPDVTSVYFRDSTGVCRGPSQAFGVVRIRDEVPRAALAGVAYTLGPSSARIAIGAFESADGLYLPAGAHDTELGFRCRLEPVSPTQAACRPPDDENTIIRYRDDACTTAVLQVYQGLPVPAFASKSHRCAVEVYAVGAQIADEPGFTFDFTGRCVAVPRESGVRWFELTPRAVAHVPRTRIRSDRRLEIIAMPAGGRALYDVSLFDRDSGEECADPADTFTVRRCRPLVTSSVFPYFRDPACGELLPLANVLDAERSCASSGPPRFAIDVLQPEFAHRRIGDPFTGPVFRFASAGCVAGPDDSTGVVAAVHEVGEPVGDDHFLGGEIVVDR